MLEPRGHDGMYGALLVEPDHPEADLAVLFMHNEGYSTMCGHATIALRALGGRQRTRVEGPETIVRLQCPCRPRGGAASRPTAAVRFESVPSFAYALDRIAPTATWGPVTVDIAYGGAFYAFLSADSIGLDLRQSPMRAIVDAGEEIAQAAAKAVPIEHPDEPDLAFLYGTILTDGGNGKDRPSRNVCIFAGRQIDRSPTGSGVSGPHGAAGGAPSRRGWAMNAGSRAAPARSSAAAPCARRRRSAAQVGDRRSRRHRAHHRARRAFGSTTTIRCATAFSCHLARRSPRRAAGVRVS